MDIAVVTSCWGNYGGWLPDWAESITRQTLHPTQVIIADMGVRDAEPLYHAIDLLNEAGIPAFPVWDQHQGMGHARNTAVAATTTEWVMHLDADDVLLPRCLRDCSQLTEEADVICIGGVRHGRVKRFPEASTKAVLNGQHCSFSCSPFRRKFWELSPFQTENDWVDSVFWVGLAHQGARFKGTTHAGFRYRDHEDSFSHKLTPSDRQAALGQWRQSCEKWQFPTASGSSATPTG